MAIFTVRVCLDDTGKYENYKLSSAFEEEKEIISK